MIILACFLLGLMLYKSRHVKGPLWALGFSWLVCMLPVATGMVTYSYLSQWDVGFVMTLLGLLLCFVAGVFWCDRRMSGSVRPTRRPAIIEMQSTMPWARIAWGAAAIGTACLCIDFLLLEGAGLDDLQALRDVYVAKEASLYARLGSVLTWGCLYCFAFALVYRDALSRSQFVVFMLPITGYFLVALFSAGRQASLQILIFALLTLALQRARSGHSQKGHQHGKPTGAVLALVMSASMIGYMGYIAIARNDGLVAENKVDVLSRLFDFEISPLLEWLLASSGEGLRTSFVEGMVYFSSSIALFSKFLVVDFPDFFYGAMSLPFIMRQLEPLTGITVIDALASKVEAMRNAGVIGVGWTTGISSYILDFGRAGAGIVLFAQGYYSAYAWNRARLGTDFHEGVIAMIMLASVIYLPLLAASAETNLLLLWLFCVGVLARTHKQRAPHTVTSPLRISPPVSRDTRSAQTFSTRARRR